MDNHPQTTKRLVSDPAWGSWQLDFATGGTLAGFAVITLVIFYAGTVFMAAATVAYALLVLGLIYRRDRILHPKLMTAGIAIDTCIVLILEVQRDAIKTAMSFSLAALQQAHIGTSSVALILYFPTLYLGWRLWKGPTTHGRRLWHRRIAVTAFVFRTLGFLLMLSFVGANR